MITIRTILCIAASRGWSLHQIDVKNVFFHDDPREEIHVTPSGLLSSFAIAHKLNRSLYGLRKAPMT